MLLGRTRPHVVLAAASLLASALTTAFGHIIWYGDSHTFFNYAYDLTNRLQFNPHLQWRPPGYPILLILTGAGNSGSVLGLIALQALAGAMIPILIYSTLRPISRPAAFIAAWGCLISGTTVAFITTVYHDALCMFFLVLTACLLVRIVRSRGYTPTWVPYALTCSLLWSAWLRPTAYLIAFVVPLYVLFLRAQPVRRIAACAMIFLAVAGGFATVRSMRAKGAPPGVFGVGSQLFYNAYLHSGGLDAGQPAAARLRRAAVDFFETKSSQLDVRAFGPPPSEEESARLFDQFRHRPEAQADAMLSSPHSVYFWSLIGISNVMLGPDGDTLLRRAAIEQFIAHPLRLIWVTTQHYLALVYGPASKFHGDAPRTQGPSFQAFAPWQNDPRPKNHIVPIGPRWMVPAEASSWERGANLLFASAYQIILPLSYVAMLFGLGAAFVWKRAPRAEVAAVFAVHLAHAAPMAALVDPEFRYQIEAAPLAMLGAGYGIVALLSAVDALGAQKLVRPGSVGPDC